MNITKDLHICGICKKIFNDINDFLQHKQKCFVIESSIPFSPSSNDLSLVNGLFSSQTVLDLTLLGNGPFPLDSYYDNEEVVGNINPLQSQEEISTQDQLNEILTSNKIINEIDEADVATLLVTELSKEVINKAPQEKEQISGKTEISNTEQEDETIFSVFKNDSNKEIVEEPIKAKKEKQVCSFCNFETHHNRDLVRHMRKHTGERPYVCCYCDKSFARQDKLTIHKRSHLGDKCFKCQLCQYATTDSGALKRHLLVHTGERPHKCQICPYRARHASHMIVHLRTHTGDNPFFCQEISCGRTFKNSSVLKRHMKDHKENSLSTSYPSSDVVTEKFCCNLPKDGKVSNKSSSCYGCQSVTFKGVKSKRGHGRGRRGRPTLCVRTHECPHCSAAFVRQDSLRSHMRLHKVSTPPPDECLQLEEDVEQKEDDTVRIQLSELKEASGGAEISVTEANGAQADVVGACDIDTKETPSLFYISNMDTVPDSLISLVQDGTIHYIADNSFL